MGINHWKFEVLTICTICSDMKTTKEKSFDAVKIQREIRDKIRAETENMTYEELKKYIEQQVSKNEIKPLGQK